MNDELGDIEKERYWTTLRDLACFLAICVLK